MLDKGEVVLLQKETQEEEIRRKTDADSFQLYTYSLCLAPSSFTLPCGKRRSRLRNRKERLDLL